MAGANSNIQVTDLDFDKIKTNLKTFLQSQDTLKDYNYEGSALSVLLDTLAYNTQYNAYYLNMVANEMFLDTALQRASVVSHAKSLGYTPKSAIAPVATVNVIVSGVTVPNLTMPKHTTFLSETINGKNYTFLTTDDMTATVNLATNQAIYTDVKLKQGLNGSASFLVNNASNPTSMFTIPDTNIDTTTLSVIVQNSSTDTTVQIFNVADNFLTLNGNSAVYFLQEGENGYQVYFGDGILGKKLTDGNIVTLTYLSTSGTAAASANAFSLMTTIGGYSNVVVQPVSAATQGAEKEAISSIKFHAPKAFGAQKRAVSKEDYITAIQDNQLGYSFDAVNVWGGEENNPPLYGQVLISVKPTGAYTLTEVQKAQLTLNVVRPISVLTVVPTFIDPDYTYIQISANVLYDAKKTTLTAAQIQSAIKNAIASFSTTALNTFNSSFSMTDFNEVIKNADPSIITDEITIKLQKKFLPNLTNSATYNLNFGVPLQKGMFQSGLSSSPALSLRDTSVLSNIIDGVYIEEVPSSTGGVESISVINPGYSYSEAPTVTIKGDGTGATAYALLNGNGSVKSIVVQTPGINYTSAIAVITPAFGDTTGQAAAAIVGLQGRFGTLRSYYNNTENVKTVINNNIGTIDYLNGVVTLNAFSPMGIDNQLGQLTISVTPTTTILSSTFNRILTVDPFDASAIIVNVTAKT